MGALEQPAVAVWERAEKKARGKTRRRGEREERAASACPPGPRRGLSPLEPPHPGTLTFKESPMGKDRSPAPRIRVREARTEGAPVGGLIANHGPRFG